MPKGPDVERTYFGIPVAPNFRNRFKEQIHYLNNIKSEGEGYGDGRKYDFREGTYEGEGLRAGSGFAEFDLKVHWELRNDVIYRRDGHSQEDLIGGELFFERQARKLLGIKKDPVIMLDLGGMLGFTWSRLALRFRKEVENSRIAFAVSNLVYDPDKHFAKEMENLSWKTHEADEVGPSSWEPRPANEREDVANMLSASRPLMHFLTGDVSGLRRAVLKLPNGDLVSLRGNVDFINENLSLAHHSQVPEIELVKAASLLSDSGAYMIARGDYFSVDFLNEGFYEYPNLYVGEIDKGDGVRLAFQTMQRKYALSHVGQVEEGNLKGEILSSHFIFRKSNAPPVEVNKSR